MTSAPADKTTLLDLDEDALDALVIPVSERVSFQLTYDEAPRKRHVFVGGIDGPSIPDAYNPGETSPGEWDDPDAIFLPANRQAVLAHFMSMAVNEAVHEALEWFRFDGKPLLDPHGEQEQRIHAHVNQLAEELFSLVDADKLDLG